MEGFNPVEIFGSYMAWKATEDTWFINFMNGSQMMYLLEGSEKSLLIDTGWGAGNIRSFVEGLTDKPILVANTHYHPDHAAGNGEFEAVMMSKNYELDAPSMGGFGPFDLSKLPYPNYEKVLVGEGDIIDLGNRKIEVMDVLPAHCNSSLFFLDRQQGLLFVGDELEAAQVNLFDNSKNSDFEYDVDKCLKNALKNYTRIKELSDTLTMILPNHNGFPLAKSYVDDYISLIEHICLGDAVIEDKLNHKYIEMDPKAPFLCRVRWNKASIFIIKEELMKVYGTK